MLCLECVVCVCMLAIHDFKQDFVALKATYAFINYYSSRKNIDVDDSLEFFPPSSWKMEQLVLSEKMRSLLSFFAEVGKKNRNQSIV